MSFKDGLFLIHRKVSASDISIQCDPIVDSINRSTQTLEKTNNFDLAEQYSLRTVCYYIRLINIPHLI